ncbi:TPA: hypothetical protein GE287_24160 [Escherichia coli]|nr:hypothetical protein [Escherichia coli]
MIVNECAYVRSRFYCQLSSVLARSWSVHATALKPPHEAGGRGGESTARWRWCGFYFFSV